MDGNVGAVVGAAGMVRPDQMSMPVRGGTLQSLGVDLYSNLGKVFGEFIANAHDSDATFIDIVVNFAALADSSARIFCCSGVSLSQLFLFTM